ncbi:VWA domain-containing protein [Roseobacter sp.]|uniref:VWA domain-containing protein n=1 Tax=Roseobacter sp. TaxID=1907202 RepID=UPI00385DDBA7
MISLAVPWALIALPLPWLVWRFAPPYREKVPAVRFPFFRQIVAATDTTPRAGSVILARSRFQMVIAVLIWCLLVVGLAAPERVGAPIEITKSARDVILAIDISGSMDEADFLAQDGERIRRFVAVQNVVSSFVQAREGDRVALIVFGSQAYLQSPLTEDLDTIVELLEETEVGMAGPHTALGDALGLSIRTFEASEIEQRLLILLSDGADTASQMSPVNAAEIAKTEGVEIFTIAVGDPDASGENRVDVQTLQEIARRTGGSYFYAGDLSALTEVYERIDALTPRAVETMSYRPRQSLAFLPLGLAAVLGVFAVAFLHLRQRRGAVA